uniref:Uncharacterized protein n=1 Tax=Anguilla anguilla TaxID=7936 RepID=A0A0E9QCV3_ANGAN
MGLPYLLGSLEVFFRIRIQCPLFCRVSQQ